MTFRRIYGKIGRELRHLRMAWYLRRHSIQCGRNPQYQHGLPIIYSGGTIKIGHNFTIQSFQTRPEIGADDGATLQIGNHVFVNKGVSIYAMQRVTIGDNCRIGDYASIWDSNFHEVTPNEGIKTSAVRIGRNVWIGRNASILPGVTIGNHSVIAANAVVTKDLPPQVIAAGVPARIIRHFDCADDYVRL